jgi:hypothetical protein
VLLFLFLLFIAAGISCTMATVNTIHDWFGFLAKGCRALTVKVSVSCGRIDSERPQKSRKQALWHSLPPRHHATP